MSTQPTFGRGAEVDMSESDQRLGGRLPLLDPAQYTTAQRAASERLASTMVPFADSVGFQTATADGRLIGPFNPALYSPGVSAGFGDFMEAEARTTSLDNRVRQAVIHSVSAGWNAPYELYAHNAEARKTGLPDEAIDTLAAGGNPDPLSDD